MKFWQYFCWVACLVGGFCGSACRVVSGTAYQCRLSLQRWMAGWTMWFAWISFAKEPYQKALNESGYQNTLTYEEPVATASRNKKIVYVRTESFKIGRKLLGQKHRAKAHYFDTYFWVLFRYFLSLNELLTQEYIFFWKLYQEIFYDIFIFDHFWEWELAYGHCGGMGQIHPLSPETYYSDRVSMMSTELLLISVSVFRDNLSHLKSYGHENLAQSLYLDPF